MNPYEALFATIAEDVEVGDLDTFHHRVLGRLTPARAMDVDPQRPVIRHLWRVIYLYYYVGDKEAAEVLMAGGRQVLSLPDREDTGFVDQLIRAHAARWTESSGWAHRGPAPWHEDTGGAEFLVHRSGITLTVRDHHLLIAAPRSGAETVTLLLPPVQRYTYPGWFVAVGEKEWRMDAITPVKRLYFTVRESDDAPEVLATVSAALIAENVAFQVKVVNNVGAFRRRDPFIVYLSDTAWERTRDVVERVYRKVAPVLRDAGPRLAREHRRGWWMADEPDTGGSPMSFGQHRSLLIAEGLVNAHIAGRNTPAGRLAEIRGRLIEDGVDPAAPYRQRRAFEVAPVGGGGGKA